MDKFPDHDFLLSLLDASIDGILAFDTEFRYTVWSWQMERISGVSSSEVLGRNAFEVFPFLKTTGVDKDYYEALAGNVVTSVNRPYSIPETGREGFYEGRYFPLRVEGKIVGGIAIIHDTTARKLAEEQAREAHQRLSFHVENSPLAVIEWDSDFRVSRWSESAEHLFGWKQEEVFGKHVGDWQFVFPEDLPAVQQVSHRQRLGVEHQGFISNRNYTKTGEVLHCEWYNSVLHDAKGNLVSVLSLVLDVTARKLAEVDRQSLLVREQEARQHAEEADRLKDEFLATLSHELRTPLTAVLGWSSLILAGEIPETEYFRAIEIIERNARSQARLIDDLLDVSRIITGNLQLDLRPVSLISIVEAASDTLSPSAQAKNIKLELVLDRGNDIIKGDATRLRQIVWNLLLNAIKFTPRGGTVLVRTETDDQSVNLIVNDTGEGISADFLPHVFDRFRQAEGSISKKQGGLGLGLAVVRYLVELHGGSVNAQSEGKGKGSTFTVSMPRATDESGEMIGLSGEHLPQRADDEERIRLEGIKVLVVEDDDDSRALIGVMLKKHGGTVQFASATVEALERLENEAFDVVISDIGMPDQDGYELIRKVRALPPDKGGRAPAIALTGYATARDRERAVAEGYQMHLAKPVESADLVQAIVKLTGR